MVTLSATMAGKLGVVLIVCTPTPGMLNLTMNELPRALSALISSSAARSVQALLGGPMLHTPSPAAASSWLPAEVTVNTTGTPTAASSGVAAPTAATTWSAWLSAPSDCSAVASDGSAALTDCSAVASDWSAVAAVAPSVAPRLRGCTPGPL